MTDIYTITLSNGITTFNVYPLESNGPGNVSIPRKIQASKPKFPIVAVNAGTDEFTIDGDYTALFIAGFSFDITGSTGNDGTYTVGSGSPATGSTAGGSPIQTTIPVTQDFTDTTVDGSVDNIFAFDLAGDLTYRFVSGQTFTVEKSAGGLNDGIYTVSTSNSSYNSITNKTTIPVVQTGSPVAPSSTGLPLGQIKYSIPSVEEATSLLIPGRGYLNYGIAVLESNVHILENFANTVAPTNPLVGQLWYDTSTETFKNWTGGSPSIWSDVKRLPDYELQVGKGAPVGSPPGSGTYTTAFSFSTPPTNKTSLQVFVNGIKQVEGASKAYTSTTPNTVIFNTGAEPALNDDVEFYGFG